MKKREKEMVRRPKRRTGEPGRGGLHAGQDAKHGFFQNKHIATPRRPEATATCKTRIFPGASIPATNRKFFFVAGMLRYRFCRKMRHFSRKRRFFQVLTYPLQTENFSTVAGMPHHGFCAPIRVFQASNTARMRTESGRPKEAHRFACKTRIFPEANIPATNRKFFFVAGMLRFGFCRKMRHFSRKRRFFQVLTYPLQTENFPTMAGMPRHGLCTGFVFGH